MKRAIEAIPEKNTKDNRVGRPYLPTVGRARSKYSIREGQRAGLWRRPGQLGQGTVNSMEKRIQQKGLSSRPVPCRCCGLVYSKFKSSQVRIFGSVHAVGIMKSSLHVYTQQSTSASFQSTCRFPDHSEPPRLHFPVYYAITNKYDIICVPTVYGMKSIEIMSWKDTFRINIVIHQLRITLNSPPKKNPCPFYCRLPQMKHLYFLDRHVENDKYPL